MSDDFDNDDLSWLEDPDEPEEEDEENLDWVQGDEQPGPEGHLGFTGDLPWMQGDEFRIRV